MVVEISREKKKGRNVRVKTGDTLLGNDLLDGIQTALMYSREKVVFDGLVS
jgi:hypothetical protein